MRLAQLLILFLLMASPLKANNTIDELKCIADNIYFEAGNQSVKGMIAVANVTHNRVHDNRYPNTFCGVVKQGYKKGRRDCQFSWYCDGKSDRIPEYGKEIYDLAIRIAMLTYHNELPDYTYGALNYHADYVNPSWAKSKRKTAKIGRHIFYKW